MGRPSKKVPMNFKGMPQVDVPQGRNGKHKAIVTRILSDLDQVQEGVALKVPLAQLTAQQGKGAVGVESCDPERRAQRCHRQRWHVPVCVERNAVEDNRAI